MTFKESVKHLEGKGEIDQDEDYFSIIMGNYKLSFFKVNNVIEGIAIKSVRYDSLYSIWREFNSLEDAIKTLEQLNEEEKLYASKK